MARERDALYSECSLMDALTRGAKLADGRAARGVRHPLTTILMLLLIGFLLGMTSYREMHRFFSPADPVASEQILTQLRTFLNLPHEIPSVSCLSRTLTVMNVHPIITCCADFLYQPVPHKADMPQHICADGKALRAAENKALTGKNLYVINTFLSS